MMTDAFIPIEIELSDFIHSLQRNNLNKHGYRNIKREEKKKEYTLLAALQVYRKTSNKCKEIYLCILRNLPSLRKVN